MGTGNRLILFDTGPLSAFADPNDQYHDEARALLHDPTDTPIIPALVVPEVAYMLQSRISPRAEEEFLWDITAGKFLVASVHSTDWGRIVRLVAQYRDFPLGTVDASIIAAAERLGIRIIATFDLRHFTVVRPTHIEAFELDT